MSVYQYISISVYQYISISAYQYISVSVYQYISISAYQHISISAYQHIRISVYQYIIWVHQYIIIYQLLKQLWKWRKAYFILLHNLVYDFWIKYHKVYVSSPWYMQAPKISTKHTKFFQLLNYTFMWPSDFYLCEHLYTYRSRREFQNIFEKKLCNCFEQLLLIY